MGASPFDGPVDGDVVLARIRDHPLGSDPAAMRRDFARLALGAASPTADLPAGCVVDEHRFGLRVSARAGAAGPEAIWLHGGGYVFGSPETHLRPAARLAARAGCAVILPRYPLAPEARWPAQRDAALAATGAAREPPILVGDSAGGHLALVAALAAARAGRPVRALVLFSPNADRSERNAARGAMSALDPMVDDAGDRRLAEMAFGPGYDPSDPAVSPLLDDLSLLPPTWIEVGDPEVLRDDAALLHGKAVREGATATLTVTPGLMHMGQLWTPWWDEATASVDRAAAFVARRLRGEGGTGR